MTASTPSSRSRQADQYGADRVLLSHGLIEDIDQIPTDTAVTENVRYLSDYAHGFGMTANVWVHELTGAFPNPVVCFDPTAIYWDDRADVYREALVAAPEIDGVNITMGSGNPAPWLSLCLCRYCLDLEPYGHVIADALNSHPDERIQLVMNTIAGVATDELGKEVIAHGFHHEAFEAEWMADGPGRRRAHRLRGAYQGAEPRLAAVLPDQQPVRPRRTAGADHQLRPGRRVLGPADPAVLRGRADPAAAGGVDPAGRHRRQRAD